MGQRWANINRNIGPTLASRCIILAYDHHTSIGPTQVQHQISLVCQCQPNIGFMYYVSICDEENYKFAFLLTFFKWLFWFAFYFGSTNGYNETEWKVATILNSFLYPWPSVTSNLSLIGFHLFSIFTVTLFVLTTSI